MMKISGQFTEALSVTVMKPVKRDKLSVSLLTCRQHACDLSDHKLFRIIGGILDTVRGRQ